MKSTHWIWECAVLLEIFIWSNLFTSVRVTKWNPRFSSNCKQLWCYSDLKLLLEPDTNNAHNCPWNNKYKTPNQNNKWQQSQTPFPFQQPFFLEEIKIIWNLIKPPEAEDCKILVLNWTVSCKFLYWDTKASNAALLRKLNWIIFPSLKEVCTIKDPTV